MNKLLAIIIGIAIFSNVFSREYLPSKEEIEAFQNYRADFAYFDIITGIWYLGTNK